MLFAFISTVVNIPVIDNTITANAATLKLNKKTLTLEVGQKKTLKVTGATKKITWTSSKKTVATVSNKGVVTAIAAGKATITATIAGKKLTCSVTVDEPDIDFVSNAPFAATKVNIDNISMVIPSNWTISPPTEDEDELSFILTPNDTALQSSMAICITTSKEESPDYDSLKGMYCYVLTIDYYIARWKESLGDIPFKITDYEQSDYESPYGKAFKVEHFITVNDTSVKTVTYEAYINDYHVQLILMDAKNLGFESIADYIISSIVVK
jgi:hypothetical protein